MSGSPKNEHIPADIRHAPFSDDDVAEARHFREVMVAIERYEKHALEDVRRIEKNFAALLPGEKALLLESVDERLEKLKAGIHLNQSFLEILLQQIEQMDDASPPWPKNDEVYCSKDEYDLASNVYRVRSTIRQFAREWSSALKDEREAAYGPLLEALQKYCPIKEGEKRPWVLCPGSGLGRLPYEIMRLGYNTQGNEFSYFMLLGSYFVLNHSVPINGITISPYVLSTTNWRSAEDQFELVQFPDVALNDAASSGGDFSMCAGDFTEIYQNQHACWDAIVTSFFIDTAHNIVQYIHLIANLLREGGMWANMGPLLYHFADSVTEASIELSYEEIKHVASRYFEFVEERWVDTVYTSSSRSMMQALYHCIHFVAIRNNVPVDSELLRREAPTRGSCGREFLTMDGS